MRLIDADELKKDDETNLIISSVPIRTGHQLKQCAEMFIRKIDKAPTIDAVQVVRCKNCKHWEPTDGIVGICKEQVIMHEYDGGVFHLYPEHEDNYFCAYGKEKF